MTIIIIIITIIIKIICPGVKDYTRCIWSEITK